MKMLSSICLAMMLAVILQTQAIAQSNLPAGVWEDLPQGFAIALTFNKNWVTLNIKNTSGTGRQIRRSSVDIQLFYKDKNGALISVQDQKKHEERMKDALDTIDPPDSRGPMNFPPKMESWYQVGLEITPDEWSLIKNNSVVCRVALYDFTSNTKIYLESSSKKLIDNS